MYNCSVLCAICRARMMFIEFKMCKQHRCSRFLLLFESENDWNVFLHDILSFVQYSAKLKACTIQLNIESKVYVGQLLRIIAQCWVTKWPLAFRIRSNCPKYTSLYLLIIMYYVILCLKHTFCSYNLSFKKVIIYIFTKNIIVECSK